MSLIQRKIDNMTEVIVGDIQKLLYNNKRHAVNRALILTQKYHNANNSSNKDNYKFREAYTCMISWVLVDKGLIEWILKICHNYNAKQLLEINSGHGFVGGLLRNSKHNFDIILTDPFLSHETIYDNRFSDIEQLTADEAINTYCNYDNIEHTILMSIWPSQYDDYAGRALIEFRKKGGKYFIYIGTSKNGCTGTPMLFDELKENWEESDIYYNQNWFFGSEKIYDYSKFYVVK